MIYLLSQTLFWLVLAFLLGLFLGWVLKGIFCGSCAQEATAETGSPSETGTGAGDTESKSLITDDMKPIGLSAPEGETDDLKRISGIGPVIEETLNDLGMFHFKQIAAFTHENSAWVDNYLAFPGRIDREGWVSQATRLAEGKQTEFAKRYDRDKDSQD